MTFEREFMAALCLGVVWVNTGLIVAHGFGDFRRLSSLRRRLAGTVGDFEGEGGATFRIVQAGRTKGDGEIHFHDRRAESALEAGTARTAAGSFVVVADPDGVWVWPTRGQVAAATRCASQAEFDALAGPALHARGAERIATVRLAGRFKIAGGRTEAGVLRGDRATPLVCSSDDARARLLSLQLRVALVLTAILVTAGLLTGLCFVGPAFGTVSVVAALGLFAYFLLVQPLGVWLSESVSLPHEAFYGGSWLRRRVPAEGSYPVGAAHN